MLLPAECPADSAAGPGELTLGGSRDHTEQGGDLLVGVPLDIVQDEDVAEAGGEPGDGALQVDPVRGLEQGDVVGRMIVLDSRELPGILPRSVPNRIDHEPAEPGAERRLPAEGREPFHRPDPNVVYHVLSPGRIAAVEPERQTVEPGHVTIVQPPERAAVLVLDDPGDEVPVAGAVQRRPLLAGRAVSAEGRTASGTTIMMFDMGLPALTTIPAATSRLAPVPMAWVVR